MIGVGIALSDRLVGVPSQLRALFNSPTLDPRITFTRASTATYFNSAGVLTTAAIDAPRIDYDPATLAVRGLLIEEQRTNLLTYSEQFNNAAWSAGGATVTPNATTAPDGTLTADLISSPKDLGVFQTITVTTATVYTSSIFLKTIDATTVLFRDDAGAGRHLIINLATGTITGTSGTIISYGVIPHANGWNRYYMTYTTDVVAARGIARNDVTGTRTFYQWGAQIELGAFPTSYIPTVASQVTRAADIATMTGTNFSSWYNQTEGTFVVEFVPLVMTARPLTVTDGTNNNAIAITLTTTVAATESYVGGAYQGNGQVTGTYAVGAVCKIAASYRLNDTVTSANGVVGTVDTAYAIPTVDRLLIGTGRSSIVLNGWIKSITYYNTRLPDSTVQGLSAL